MAVLESTAEGLKKYPRLKVELRMPHRQGKGPDAYNLTLSQKRADAVRNYLLKAGVPSDADDRKGLWRRPADRWTTTRKTAARRIAAS